LKVQKSALLVVSTDVSQNSNVLKFPILYHLCSLEDEPILRSTSYDSLYIFGF